MAERRRKTHSNKQQVYVDRRAVLAMGFTPEMIQDLLPSPTVLHHAHQNSVPVQVWDREMVQAVMKTKRFQQARGQKNGQKAPGKRQDSRANVIRRSILDHIPDDYTQLYPEARSMARHFVLHIGPTNSGKTHDAMQALHQAEHGIYLAPLRLLAFEQYVNLTELGIPGSLITGEERMCDPEARIQCSTIEMLDPDEHFDVAVIDEAQMLADESRGQRWTTAILGTAAAEIHVCLAPEAEKLVCRLIEACHDTWEIKRHERFVPLKPDLEQRVQFPNTVLDGDAYIVFSRKDVHACASALKKKGIDASVIYGALPYDVRQNEARKFQSGETKVIVATDAIGMGLNLPIRRVVFLRTAKFDGTTVRDLTAAEVKQIAGRAGRYGLADVGLFTAERDLRFIQARMNEDVKPPETAFIGFPESLLGIDARLSEILTSWEQHPMVEGYSRGSVARERDLARTLEKATKDKQLIYQFVTMPFDETDATTLELWTQLFLRHISGIPFRAEEFLPEVEGKASNQKELKLLEMKYRLCDLVYFYASRFRYDDQLETIMEAKRAISAAIMEKLKTYEWEGNRCKYCGRPLKWDDPFTICERCYRNPGRSMFYAEERRWGP